MIAAPCARDLPVSLLEFFIFHVDHTDIRPRWLRLLPPRGAARSERFDDAREQVAAVPIEPDHSIAHGLVSAELDDLGFDLGWLAPKELGDGVDRYALL
jgi:hypothetical protein